MFKTTLITIEKYQTRRKIVLFIILTKFRFPYFSCGLNQSRVRVQAEYFLFFFMVCLFSILRSRVIRKYYMVRRVPYGYDYHLLNKAEKLKTLNSPTPISYDTYSRFAAVMGVITSELSTNYSFQTTGRLKYLPPSPRENNLGEPRVPRPHIMSKNCLARLGLDRVRACMVRHGESMRA